MLDNMMKGLALLLVSLLLFPPAAAMVAVEDDGGAAAGWRPPAGPEPSWMGEPSPAPAAAGGRVIIVPPEETQRGIGRIAGQVSDEYILSYLTRLEGYGSRYLRAPGMYNATAWLYEALLGNGRIQAQLHNWSYVNASGVTHWVSSVILTLPGVDPTSNRIYYLFNHDDAMLTWPSPTYNDLMTDVPGADDDATGVAATLEAARVLSRFQFQDTLRFAFFNGEEIGLYGSYYWAQTMAARKENVPASIDFDMVGYNPGLDPYDLALMSNQASFGQVQYLMDVNSRYGLGLRIYPYQTGSGQTIPSDITSFYNFGYTGVMGIEYPDNPNYHTKSDRVRTLNVSMVADCSRLAVASLCEMARLLYAEVNIPPGNLTVSNERPIEGEQVSLSVNISNSGNLNATDMEVAFYADGLQFDSKRLWVPANGTNTTAAVWSAAAGKHRLSVVLDPRNEIQESDETNNSAELTLTVNDRPRAVLTVSPTSALTNESVMFNGSLSSDGTGSVVRYRFDFGDGNGTDWTDSPVAVHAYPQNGDYKVGLEVEDNEGARSGVAGTMVLILNRPPIARPYSNVTRALMLDTIQFLANASDPDGLISVSWDFGDGDGSGELDPVHNYSEPGTYDVHLRVLDDDGATADSTVRIFIDGRAPRPFIIAGNTTGDREHLFVFAQGGEDYAHGYSSYYWEVTDGANGQGPTFQHEFDRPGNFTIWLTTKNRWGLEGRASVNITVIDRPPRAVASVSTIDTDTLRRIQFFGVKSSDLEGPVTFQWDFGDGNGSTEAAPYHAYSRPGNYTASLVVTDTAGQKDCATVPAVTVHNRPPVAEFRTFGCFTQNGTLYFDATGSSDPEGPLMTYRWEFGDGAAASGPVVEHVFPSSGNYTVNLTVTDADGGTASRTQVITVLPPPPPPVITKPREEVKVDSTWLVNGWTALALVLLVTVLAAGIYIMRQKPGPPPVRYAGPSWEDAASGPGEGSVLRTTGSKEFSPAEEQLKGAPRH